MKQLHAVLCAAVLVVAVSEQPAPAPVVDAGIYGRRIVNLYASNAPMDPRRPWTVYEVPADKWLRITDASLYATYATKRNGAPCALAMDLLSKEGKRVHIMRSRWHETWHSSIGYAFPPGSEVCFSTRTPHRTMVEGCITYEITGYLTDSD